MVFFELNKGGVVIQTNPWLSAKNLHGQKTPLRWTAVQQAALVNDFPQKIPGRTGRLECILF